MINKAFIFIACWSSIYTKRRELPKAVLTRITLHQCFKQNQEKLLLLYLVITGGL